MDNLSRISEVLTEIRKCIKREYWACVAFGAFGTAAGGALFSTILNGTASSAAEQGNHACELHLIHGTIHQANLRRYQIESVKMSLDSGNLGIAGIRYWRNFKKRNKDKLDTGVPVAQAACRKEWSSYQNFSQMYDLVYEQMEEARV